MATKKQALEAIARLGGSIDWEVSHVSSSHCKDICIDAPRGYNWEHSLAPSIAIYGYYGTAAELWDEVIERVTAGIYEMSPDELREYEYHESGIHCSAHH